MSLHDFTAESPDNYEQKCCCALVLDVSGSMEGAPIRELNEGLREFYKDIQTDSTTANRLEVAVIEFSDEVKTLIEPSLASKFRMPTLTTKGTTKLVDGVREGIKVVQSRKNWYKKTGQPYYRPWVILISDAAPDEGQDISGLTREIRTGMSNREFFFFALGVQGADMNMLKNISDPSMQAAKLQGLKFSEFFKWLSASMTTVTHSKDGDKVNLPNPAEWMIGFSI
ncbi:MAG: VWA domain-containing protein [Bacteroidetes bacterium]|nr:VWA domain-containing protein [Bacteroidota bacterium]